LEPGLNISNFKYLIFIFFALTLLSPCFAEENINFSVGTGLSYLNGQYREIVYPSAGWESPYLSELLWNLDNIFLLNLTADVKWRSWSLYLSVSASITTETGEMTDTDWLDSSSTGRTHWSLSRIWLDNSFILNTGIRHSINLTKYISIQTGLGYKLNFWDWEDEVLDYIYQDPQPADFIGVNGIDYKVIQNIFYASAEINYIYKDITTGINMDLSPFIYTWDLDHHILTNTYYMDSVYANFWYKLEFTIDVNTGSNKKLMFSLFREELPESKGDTFVYDEDPTNPEKTGDYTGTYVNGAGMASILWGISLSYTWTF